MRRSKKPQQGTIFENSKLETKASSTSRGYLLNPFNHYWTYSL